LSYNTTRYNLLFGTSAPKSLSSRHLCYDW